MKSYLILIKPLYSINIPQEIQKNEEHVKLLPRDAIIKIQTVGNCSTKHQPSTTPICYTGKKRERKNIIG